MCSLSRLGRRGADPGHQGVDVLVEMAVGELREEVAEMGAGVDAVQLAGAGQAGEAGPVSER
jgi:hypothetical protein